MLGKIKNIIWVLNALLLFMLTSCNYRVPLNNLNIEEAISKLSKGKITVRSGLFESRIFEYGDNSYIEMPYLQNGFFLYYHSSNSLYPVLTHVRGRENNPDWVGNIFNVEKIYFYDNAFIVESEQLLYKIRYEYNDYIFVDYLDNNYIKKWIFNPIQPHNNDWFKIDSGLYYFMEGDHVLVRGVYQFEIGILNDVYHIWGESVFGFFDINMETLDIIFPVDKTQYNAPIHFSNNRISRNYKGKINNLIDGRNKIEIFREVEVLSN